MEGEENRREQTPGSASHGGGKVCHRCGWVYPNPHPSKKHRTAHRKHCSATASGLSDGAADVAAAVEVKKAPPEQLSDEDPRNVSGEEVVEEEPKPEGEKGRGMGQSGVDVEEPCKGAILEADVADYSPESDASCHGNKVLSSDVESTASQLDDTIHLDNDSVTCRGDKVCTMEGTDSSSESPLTKGFCLDALEEMDHAAVQNMVDSATVEDNIIIGNYVEDKLDMQIPGPQILPHGSCANSSLTNSEFQRIDKSMEFSMIVDQANAITTLVSGLPDEVSANTMEFESVICTSPDEKTDVAGQISQVQPFCNDGPSMGFSMIVDQANAITTLISGLSDEVSAITMEFESVICTSPDEKTDVAGQISQVQPFCNDGSCNLEITDGELFETPTHLSACGYQIALHANSPVDGNDPECLHSLPISSNMLLVEYTKVKIESLEDSWLVEPDLTICANAEAGSNIGRHVIDELSVVESDKNAKSISSTLQVNVNEMERDESNDERNCQDMNSDRSQVVNEFEFEDGASANKFEGPKGESDWLKTPEQVPSVNKAMDLDDRVPNSCETCYLYKGKGTNLSHEGISADNLRVADSAVSLSGMSQFSATSEISNNSQIVRQGTTEINIDALVEDKNLEMFKENNMDLKTNSQPEGHTTELEPPTRDDIGRTELQNNEDVIVADSVLSLTQEDFSFRCLRSVLNNYLDQQDVQETPVERFKQNADLDETIDQSQRQAEAFFKEEISENGLPSEHYDTLYPNKDETNKMETTCGYQLELQNVFVVGSINHVSSDKNNSYNPFVTEMDHVPTAEKEYSLLTILEDEPNTNAHSKAGLCHDDEEILKTEECSESKVDVRSFIGKPGNDYDSKTSDRSGVAPSIFYQSSKEEDVHDKSMQQNEFYIEKVDYSINSNSQTGNIDAVSESVPDGAIPSLSSAMEEGSNFDAEVSPPTDSLVTRDLHTSDPTTEGTTHKSNLDHNDTLEEPSDPAADSLATKDLHTSDPATERTIHNLDHNDTLEEPSLIPLVEPEQKSDSIENKSVHDSKDEPEGRNIKEENTAGKVPDSNAGKPHVMLKNLLAEAELESKQEATGSQGYNASPSSKRSCGGSQDDGQSLRTAISDGPLDTQADHREWNSPARLPVTKHEKKKAKGRQSWVPFICCPSVN
uniref:Uncharacterized protein n=1 Tax=Musa acuminata subsp. malaccensis TaxID=214687 RepID=A0A804KTF5_MUSAM|nr:PREDICTED: uncharacterized protein LOC104000095 isoform X2 [Musa acuminata subsp. malaccensis]XP_018675338.1 PREDICTED: uncharacterized protein LOC104000095 isoform X1 [Musa acuminata subsp. malaccensis]